MMKKNFLLLLAMTGVFGAALTGCQTLEQTLEGLAVDNSKDIQTIDENLYSVTVYIRTESRTVAVREAAFKRATNYCNDKDKGALLLDAVSQQVKEGGSKATVVFRCVNYMKAPEGKSIFSD